MAPFATELPPLLVAVPVAGACVLLAAGRFLPRAAIDAIAMLVAVAQIGLAGWLLAVAGTGRVVNWSGGWQPKPGLTVGIVLSADRVGAGLAVLIAVLTAVGFLFGWRYFDSQHAHYPALLLLFVAGMSGFALTGDLFNMFVFFELMGAAAYALTGLKIEEAESVQGGLNFAVINSLGAYFALFGIGMVYARTGQLGLPQLGRALAGGHQDALLLAAFVLVATGWLVKAAATPFHFWLADAHAVAPAPVCVLFSGVMAPLGVYGVARIYFSVFDAVVPASAMRRMALVIGIATAVVGTVMCLLQRHIKRLLAYSTIAHIGLFLIGLSALTPLGIAAAAAYLSGHAAVKGALFLLAGLLLSRYRCVDEHRLFGRARDHRGAGALFVLAGLALAGMPPFGPGLGKALLEEAGHAVPLTVLIIVVSGLTGGAVLRVGLRVYFGLGAAPDEDGGEQVTGGREEPDVETPRRRTPWTMPAAIVTLLTIALLCGLPLGFQRRLGPAAAAFTDSAGYRSAALLGRAAPPLSKPPETEWTCSGVVFGVLSTVLAALVAAWALYPARLPRRAPRLPARVTQTLHRLHSGHVGDYTAWLVAGAACVAGLLAWR